MVDKLLATYKLNLQNLLNEKGLKVLDPLLDDFIVKYTYDAISLEGKNKVPFEDVRRLIRTGVLVGYSNKEESEINNHVLAFEHIREILKRGRDLTEEQLKDIHSILMTNILVGGVYRNVNVQIVGGTHQPPDNIKVYDRMARLFNETSSLKLEPLDKGIYIHANIAKIYPFVDGNGRAARLVLNYYLMLGGYLPVSVPLSDRDEYFEKLEYYKVNKDIEPLTRYIKKLLVDRYENAIEELDK